jgi:hypothetical protein
MSGKSKKILIISTFRLIFAIAAISFFIPRRVPA